MFRTRRSRRKLLALLFGVLIAAVLVEIALRAFAFVVDVSVRPPVETVTDNIRYLIVCVGDSHTAGVGAPKGLGYPQQLEARLNDGDGSDVHVVNMGQPGSNSSEVVTYLKNFMAVLKREPDLIVFCAGKNNDHNFRQARIAPELSPTSQPADWARYLLSESRAFRLSQITVKRLQGLTESTEWELEHSFLNHEGAGEQVLLRRWLELDLREVKKAAPCPVVLLNYWTPVAWVDTVYAQVGQEEGFSFVNVIAFGKSLPLTAIVAADLTEPGFGSHPNERGYALIAELVERHIRERELLPKADQLPN